MHRRSGFSLVEMLVVVAIIVMLASLLLPAVQNARAAANRAACQNNLRQIALALHNYHDAFKSFPPILTTGSSGPTYSTQHSWRAYILPFLDQEQVWEIVYFPSQPLSSYKTFSPDNSALGATNLPAAQHYIPSFICPSDPAGNTTQVPQSGGRAPANYVGNQGSSANFTFGNGVFYRNSNTRIEAIRDGTSNTLMASECLRGDFVTYTYVGMRNSGANAANIATCQDFPPNFADRGVFWVGGQSSNSTFNASRPPNDPRLDCWGPNLGVTNFAARSAHIGGVNAALCDGSVRFFADTIDPGIWAAMGTRAGGDNATGAFFP